MTRVVGFLAFLMLIGLVSTLAQSGDHTEPAAPTCGDMVSSYVSDYYAAHGEPPSGSQVGMFRQQEDCK